MAEPVNSSATFKKAYQEALKRKGERDFETADGLLAKAIAWKENISGSKDANVLILRDHHAGCKFALEKYAEAEAYNRETLARRETLEPADSKKRLAFTRNELAKCMMAQYILDQGKSTTVKCEEAVELLERSCLDYTSLGETDKDLILPILPLLSFASSSLERYDDAERIDREALQRTLKKHPDDPSHEDVIILKSALAKDLLYLRRYDEAKDLYTGLLDLMKTRDHDGLRTTVTIAECEQAIVYCTARQDNEHRAITQAFRNYASTTAITTLRATAKPTAQARWHLAIAEVIRTKKMASIIDALQNKKRIAKGRWTRAIRLIIKRNRVAFIVDRWKSDVAEKQNKTTIVNSGWRQVIASMMITREHTVEDTGKPTRQRIPHTESESDLRIRVDKDRLVDGQILLKQASAWKQNQRHPTPNRSRSSSLPPNPGGVALSVTTAHPAEFETLNENVPGSWPESAEDFDDTPLPVLPLPPDPLVQPEDPPSDSDSDHRDKGERSQATLFDSEDAGRSGASEKWIRDFDSFSKFLARNSRDEDVPRIRVAILDTGIDADHDYIKKKWRSSELIGGGYQDFVSDDPRASPKDNDGHGTHVAGIILRFAPNADLYIARIADTNDSIREDKRIAERVSKAMSYAIKTWEVNIISMSFGLRTTAASIDDCIIDATKRKIILFAAASNDGNRRSVSYPARDNNVMCVNASDGDGTPASFNPPSREGWANFSILGMNVESTWPSFSELSPETRQRKGVQVSRKLNGMSKYMSGTSVATPFAAALTASLYAYGRVNAAVINSPEPLESYRSVRRVLEMMSIHKNGYSDIVPWEGRDGFFRPYKKSLATILSLTLEGS